MRPRCTKQQAVFRRDVGRNCLRPDAIALLLKTHGPHDIDGDGSVNPPEELGHIAGGEIVTARQDGNACARLNGAIKNSVGQGTAGMARDNNVGRKNLDIL